MKNLKIGTRLTAGFAVILLMLAAISGVSYYNVSNLNGNVSMMTTVNWEKADLVDEITEDMNEAFISAQTMALTTSSAVIKKENDKIVDYGEKVGQKLNKLDKLVHTEAGKKLLAAARASRERYKTECGIYRGMIRAGKQKEALPFLQNTLTVAKHDLSKVLKELSDHQDLVVENLGAESAKMATTTNSITLVMAAAALIIGLLLSFYLSVSITRPLNACVLAAEKIANGDTNVTLDTSAGDEAGALQRSMAKMTTSINLLIGDAKALSDAAVAGRLTSRADATRHHGDFRIIVQGVNDTLDAIIGPLNVSAEYMDRISKGDIPPKITDSYNGDFNEIKNNLNVCITAIGDLVSDGNQFAEAAVAGTLGTRIDATRHQGDFRKIIYGFNSALDAVTIPIREVRSIMESMAEGDLTRRMTGDVRGEFAILKERLNNSMVVIATAINNVTQNARQVASASAQTSSAVGQISDGSQNQVHAIGLVATAIKQTAESITDVSRNTEEATLRAKDSVLIVQAGEIKMRQMVEVVNNIATNSEKIYKITDVIEKIANKTNLLSLNAAIEAARAGEHGRGFAVVADEVGKLAANAADSTQEIVALVNQAVKEANQAVVTVNEVSGGMQKISNGALQTESMLQRISAALEAQTAAVQEINVNISSLNKVAESNASASEEITATIVELARLADNNRKVAEQFRV